MKKLILLSFFTVFTLFNVYTQIKDTLSSTESSYKQGLHFTFNLPGYPSKIGYFFNIHHSSLFQSQYDFALGLSPSLGYKGSWNFGTSIHQNIFIGRKIKYKISLSEDLYFNTLALSSKAQNYQPWDRPGKFVIYTCITNGVEFPLVTNKFFMSPHIGGGFGHGPRDLSTGETNVFKWFFYGTIILGIDLKINL